MLDFFLNEMFWHDISMHTLFSIYRSTDQLVGSSVSESGLLEESLFFDALFRDGIISQR